MKKFLGLRRCAALLLAAFGFFPAEPAMSAEIGEVARLIRLAEPGLRDDARWAKAIVRAMDLQNIEKSRENICAAIAVIDQESNFEANPKVPGLGKMAAKAFRKKVDGNKSMQLVFSALPGLLAQLEKEIGAAKSERDLDLATRRAFDQIRANWVVEALIRAIDEYGSESGIFEYYNEVKTVGSMQVSVAFARQSRLDPASEEVGETYELRDHLYTVEGGVELGVLQLLGYSTPYAHKVHRFADYNAGRYASRNAAFQKVIATLSGAKIMLDGDLLRYGKDSRPSDEPSQTESWIRHIVAEHGLALGVEQIRRDLTKEKKRDFEETATFRRVRALYRKTKKAEAPMAIIPEIRLESVKLSQGWTTRRFAEKVDGRYKACMKRWRG